MSLLIRRIVRDPPTKLSLTCILQPVRWTPENDRILLLKLIETHAISVNYQLIANAWRKYPSIAKPLLPTIVVIHRTAMILLESLQN
jgi:hypothetical protein